MACHVDDCATATLPPRQRPVPPSPCRFQRADVSGSLVTRADGSLRLVVNWIMVGSDGRSLHVVVSDAAGAELASLDETAIFPVASMSSGACLLCPALTLGDPA